MAKKRVAVFGNAWGYEFFQLIMRGVQKYAKEHTVDVDFFVNYSSEHVSESIKIGEMNLYRLPDLNCYDGVIVMANSINVQAERDFLQEELRKAKIPCVCLEYELEGLNFMGSDNYSGMYELAQHVFDVHGARNILYIGGPKDNTEAQQRRQAVIDVAKEYGVPVTDENFIYGDWSFYFGGAYVIQYLEKNGKLPDAIICANDVMAIGICEMLPTIGYKAGIDVAVTGFDGLRQGAMYYPSITSVGRNWNSMGYVAMQQILEEKPAKTPKRIELKSSLSLGESCGCELCKEKLELRRLGDKEQGKKYVGNVELDIHMRMMYGVMHNCSELHELHEKLSPFIRNEGHYYESDAFFLCLDPKFFLPQMEDEELLKTVGYPEKMVVATGVYEGNIMPVEEISSVDIVPSYVRQSEKENIMLVVSLFLEEKTIGYVAMRADEMQFQEMALYLWSRHITQNLEQIRQNIQINALTAQLMLLSTTDGMTGLYNRRGYTKIVQPYYEQNIEQDNNMAFIMCDIDDMKTINDEHGHLFGDLAICTLANAIKESIPAQWYGCRYGGDEFLIIGTCNQEDEIQHIVTLIEENIKKQVAVSKMPVELVASIGGIMIDANKKFSLEAAVKYADDRMYEIKSAHKARYGGQIR
ncbi:MAG: GGDEF domain-containing protein [Eubacteriales bacterium]|nr:GGDEF domain-containing protein [Eubacteriales bacterium]